MRENATMTMRKNTESWYIICYTVLRSAGARRSRPLTSERADFSESIGTRTLDDAQPRASGCRLDASSGTRSTRAGK